MQSFPGHVGRRPNLGRQGGAWKRRRKKHILGEQLQARLMGPMRGSYKDTDPGYKLATDEAALGGSEIPIAGGIQEELRRPLSKDTLRHENWQAWYLQKNQHCTPTCTAALFTIAKDNVVHPNNETLFSLQKDSSSAICYNVDEP